MALLATGKRKRREELLDQHVHQLREPDQGSRSPDDDTLQALFRKHFEAQFAPLEVGSGLLLSCQNDESLNAKENNYDESESEEEAEWGGISDEEGEKKIAANIIEYQSTEARTGETLLHGEFKSFMVCIRHLS